MNPEQKSGDKSLFPTRDFSMFEELLDPAPAKKADRMAKRWRGAFVSLITVDGRRVSANQRHLPIGIRGGVEWTTARAALWTKRLFDILRAA